MGIINFKTKMNKLVFLALVGSTQACAFTDIKHWFEKHFHHPGKHHHHGHHHKSDIINYIFHIKKTRNCVGIEEHVTPLEHWRQFLQAGWRGLVKGFYQENQDVITEECYGEWLQEPYQKIHDTYYALKKDSFDVPVDQVKDAVVAGVDAWYKNREVCQIPKVRDDGWNWTLANPEKALYWQGTEDRLWDAALPLAGKALDLYKLFWLDDRCYTVKEQAGEIYRLAEDVGEILSTAWGFDLMWAQSDNAQRVHVSKDEFLAEVHEWKNEHKESKHEKWAKAFPDLVEIHDEIKEFKHEIHNEIKHEVEGVKKMLFPTHHHSAHQAAPKQAQPAHHKMFNPFDFNQLFPKLPTHINHFF